MKVLNRPMFRYGGPIKEGIMSGIKEPRQGYAEPPSFVIKNDPNKMIVDRALKNAEAFMKAGQVYDQDLNNQAFVLPSTNQTSKISSFNKMMENNQFANQDPTKIKNVTIEDKIKAYEPNPENPFRDILDYTKKLNVYEDEKGVKRDRSTGKIIRDTDVSEVVTEPRGPQELGITTRKAVKSDENLPGDNDPPAPNKKERVNTILESLGYDRAQKNALYDAMIKAGQRISRGGLGAENLVSDVIAETSQSYDKPEKLREAANLMQVQQDLKLDQIEASKTGGAMAQNYQYFLDRNYSPEAAARKAEGLATNLLEAKNKAIDAKLTGNKLTEYVAQQLIGIKDAYDNNTYKGTINSKDHKTVSDFAASTDFDGAGVYTVKGRIIELDENGKILKEEIVTSSTSDKKWWNFGKEE